jgi:hypothetical protein
MESVILKSRKEAVMTLLESCHWWEKMNNLIKVLVLKGTSLKTENLTEKT